MSSSGLSDFKRAFGILMFAASSLAALKTLAELSRRRQVGPSAEDYLASIDERLAQLVADRQPTETSGLPAVRTHQNGHLDFEDLLL